LADVRANCTGEICRRALGARMLRGMHDILLRFWLSFDRFDPLYAS
jgi:hypothetical protein